MARERGPTIEMPLEALPGIDEHGVLVLAPREVVWDAVVGTVRGFSSRRRERGAELLGCSETMTTGDPERIGSTLPGFVVMRVVKPAVLALAGQHRFSRYGLVFILEPTDDDRTLLRAETRAVFPGLRGRIYRALVIGTRGHVLAVHSILRAVRKRAERTAESGR
jgi:hypothetical protein